MLPAWKLAASSIGPDGRVGERKALVDRTVRMAHQSGSGTAGPRRQVAVLTDEDEARRRGRPGQEKRRSVVEDLPGRRATRNADSQDLAHRRFRIAGHGAVVQRRHVRTVVRDPDWRIRPARHTPGVDQLRVGQLRYPRLVGNEILLDVTAGGGPHRSRQSKDQQGHCDAAKPGQPSTHHIPPFRSPTRVRTVSVNTGKIRRRFHRNSAHRRPGARNEAFARF